MAQDEIVGSSDEGIPPEGQRVDHKSLRLVQGGRKDFEELARDCVAFATSGGGTLFVGIEDGQREPPPTQVVDEALLAQIPKRIGELTVNVPIAIALRYARNGGAYIELTVFRAPNMPSTRDGRYFVRLGDTRQPVVGDDVRRLFDQRAATPWELQTQLQVPTDEADPIALETWLASLRASQRVKPSVREKADRELLDHYNLSAGGKLTNLGVLLLGSPQQRARLGTAPVVQAIKYDGRDTKVGKWVWDDGNLSPVQLIGAVWDAVPDFRESYEFPDGLFRTNIPAYDEAVVRELLVNALVHRPYTQGGDIFINLHPEHLEVVNPGRLPLGVTPDNILNKSQRRNENLARVFHDLGLMEREGSGIDLMYDRLLSTGRPAPSVREGIDSVHVLVSRRVLNPRIMDLIHDADARHQLRQRERITLGRLALSEGMRATELARELNLASTDELGAWLGRLCELGLVNTRLRTQAKRYFVAPELLRGAGLDKTTTLARVEPYRLRALIEEDLRRYPGSSSGDIHRRVGPEIPIRTLRRALAELTKASVIRAEGQKRGRKYYPGDDYDHGGSCGR